MLNQVDLNFESVWETQSIFQKIIKSGWKNSKTFLLGPPKAVLVPSDAGFAADAPPGASVGRVQAATGTVRCVFREAHDGQQLDWTHFTVPGIFENEHKTKLPDPGQENRPRLHICCLTFPPEAWTGAMGQVCPMRRVSLPSWRTNCVDANPILIFFTRIRTAAGPPASHGGQAGLRSETCWAAD